MLSHFFIGVLIAGGYLMVGLWLAVVTDSVYELDINREFILGVTALLWPVGIVVVAVATMINMVVMIAILIGCLARVILGDSIDEIARDFYGRQPDEKIKR